jgi:EthD domain
VSKIVNMSSASPQKVYALTICGYRKPGMSEEDYHEYVSQRHAPCLKELLFKNGILDYTVVSVRPH